MKTIRETPRELIFKMVMLLDLHKNPNYTKHSILEPSAGSGKIADYLRENIYDMLPYDLTCVELNEDLCECLKIKEHNYHRGDFLSFKPIRKFSRIIACPPFKGNIDLEHIKHMYNLLEDDGIIVTLTSPYWVVNNEPSQVEFRKWLSDKVYEMYMVADNTFVEKEKTVPTAILKICK